MSNKNRILKFNILNSSIELIPIQADISEHISSTFSIKLTCISSNLDISEKELIGKPSTISLNLSNKKYFNGIIESFQSGRIENNIRYYSIHIVPTLYFLNFSCDCKIYPHKESFQIVKDIHNNFSIKVPKICLKRSYLQREYNVQYNESYLNYIQRILEKDGIYYYFKHNEKEHQLILDDQSTSAENCATEVGITPNKQSKCFLIKFEKFQNYYPDQFSGIDTNYDALQENFLETVNTSRNSQFTSDVSYKLHKQHSETQKDLKLYLQNISESYRNSGKYFKAESHWPYFEIAKTLELNQSPNPNDLGKYFILAIHHIIHDYTGIQNKMGGYHYQNHLLLLPANIPFRPSQSTPEPEIIGPQAAEVVGPKNTEIYTDHLGRIKVRFQWMRNDQQNEASCWIPVAQTFAGKGYGMWFLPRIGDFVIVQFLSGNPERPIITGSFHHPDNPPPFHLPEEKTFFGIKSSSTPQNNSKGANEFYFNDASGEEAIHLKAQKNLFIEVNENQQIKIKGNNKVEIKNGDYAVQIDQGECSIQAKNRIHLQVGSSLLEISENCITLKAEKIKLNST